MMGDAGWFRTTRDAFAHKMARCRTEVEMEKKREILSDNRRREELSFSYLNAISAAEGIACQREDHDAHDVDATIKKWVKRPSDNREIKVSAGIQLKSTSKQLTETETTIHYPLDQDNLNDLRLDAIPPSYVALLVLPRDEREWIRLTVDELCIRKCMYIKSLKGFSENGNTSGTTIIFDKKEDLLTADKLNSILIEIAEAL